MNTLVQRLSNSSFNSSNSSTQDVVGVYYKLSPDERAAFSVVYGTLGSVGFVENILVFAAFYSCRLQLDVPSNWFVLSLAVADASVSLLAILFGLFDQLGVILDALISFAIQASSGNLFFLTLNRFISVYKSLHYHRHMTVARAKFFVAVSWTTPALLAALVTISVTANLVDLYYIVVSYYAALTLATVILNAYILSSAWQQRKKIKKQYYIFLTGQQRHLKNELRLFLRLLIISVTFFAASIPSIIVLYMHPSNSDRNSETFVKPIKWIFVAIAINSVIDPFVYFFNSNILFNRFQTKMKNFMNWKSNKVQGCGHVTSRNDVKRNVGPIFLVWQEENNRQ